jgi:DNA-binding FrmR family transcriptional regulator
VLEKQENRNKCADISLEISAIRCEIWDDVCAMKQENRNKCADISLEISAIRCEIK